MKTILPLLIALLLAPLLDGTEGEVNADSAYLGRRRNGAAIGFINLLCNPARYEQIARLKLIPLPVV